LTNTSSKNSNVFVDVDIAVCVCNGRHQLYPNTVAFNMPVQIIEVENCQLIAKLDLVGGWMGEWVGIKPYLKDCLEQSKILQTNILCCPKNMVVKTLLNNNYFCFLHKSNITFFCDSS
jgi:hypothetical protein